MNPSTDLNNAPASGVSKGRGRRYTVLVLCSVLVSIVILVGLMNRNRNLFIASGDAMAAIRTIETNLLRYKNMAGHLPSEVQGLHALVEQPMSDPVPKAWHKLTEASYLIDPWGHPYQYRNSGRRNANSMDVYSMGPDGREGTEDDVYARSGGDQSFSKPL